MASVWKEYPLEFGGYKFSENEASEVAHQYRRRCIAELIVGYYNTDNKKAMELADRVIEIQDNAIEVLTEDDAISIVAEESGLGML